MTTFQAIVRLHELKEENVKLLNDTQDRAERHKELEGPNSELSVFYAREVQKLKEYVAALDKAGQMMSKR
ncbi:MAG: hypothetical protein AMXMBFR7_33200 [Planctomycetota bacterium]